jgi:hypothetical protein
LHSLGDVIRWSFGTDYEAVEPCCLFVNYFSEYAATLQTCHVNFNPARVSPETIFVSFESIIFPSLFLFQNDRKLNFTPYI